MKGTLELLCGPSGVGKSSSFGEKKKAYTYTTREPRPNEVDGVDRRFVSQSEFERLVNEGLILAPYEAFGNRYGFASDLRVALLKGEQVSEQIVPYDAIDDVVNSFFPFGDCKKILFLAGLEDIKRRRIHRKKEDNLRDESDVNLVLPYVNHLNDFDDIFYKFPEIISGEKFSDFIDFTIKEFEDTGNLDIEYDSVDGSLSRNLYILKHTSSKEDIIKFLKSYKQNYPSERILIRTYPSKGLINDQIVRITTLLSPKPFSRIFSDILGVYYIMDDLGFKNLGDIFARVEDEFKSIYNTGNILQEDFIGKHIQKQFVSILNDGDPKKLPIVDLLSVLRSGNVLLDLSKKSGLFEDKEAIFHTIVLSLISKEINSQLLDLSKYTGFLDNSRNVILYSQERIGYFGKLLESAITQKSPLFKEIFTIEGESQFLNLPIDLANLNNAFDSFLFVYGFYRKKVSFLDDLANRTVSNLKKSNDYLFNLKSNFSKYALFYNNRFLENLIRIRTSDTQSQNTRDNLHFYPFVGTAQQMLQEYWVIDFPSKEETYEKIKDNLSKLKLIL